MRSSMNPVGNQSVRAGRGVAVLGVMVAVVGGLSEPANADISDIVFRIRATATAGQGEWVARLSDGGFDPEGVWRWSLVGTRELRSESGVLLGTLTGGSVAIIEDPLVSIGFAVQAGAVDTTFQITSALLSFPTLDPAEGRASGSITGTDINDNGVMITGLHSGSMLAAHYNGFVPAGTNFANLLSGPVGTTEAFGSASLSDASPGMGFSPIPVAVTDISLQYFFSLSASDIASGTGTFVVIPGPGAAGLLALAGLAATRRRR